MQQIPKNAKLSQNDYSDINKGLLKFSNLINSQKKLGKISIAHELLDFNSQSKNLVSSKVKKVLASPSS